MEEVAPVPKVGIDNQSYDLSDPNSLEAVVDLSMAQQQAAGTSRSQVRQTDELYEGDHEKSFENYKIDKDEYETI
ncbi:UNVERIFIED_CONTAM: hypothetical protein Sindi_2634300 [Sesamum indicum]